MSSIAPLPSELPRPAKTVKESQHETSELMMPQDANNLGHVFGGVILSMMDKTAAIAAFRHSRSSVVTASIDRVDFREPIHLGDLVVMKSSVNYVGRSSMEVGVRVSLELAMTICVRAGYSRSDVHSSVLELLGTRDLRDGRRGLFHPDVLSFAQSVYLSPIYAAVRSVPGVESVEITAFGRQGQTADKRPLREGVLTLGRLEIPRLDNDRNFPEHGVLRLTLIGGQ